ncbi:Tudor domain-containing protein 12 [Cricetulus griseus]|uniref:Tudor domain-containing protein 12 n=1 Tax=Cricetulus griseus TaxID=10029 RepID=G3HF18_CRIGR|nr:Tudor domain-containing protein 12 [Cricetulus griseus]
MRNSILAQVLDQSARARLSNLALVKPEKTKAVENYLIQMARYGQLSGKVSEQGLIEILEKVSQQTEKKTTVKVCVVYCQELKCWCRAVIKSIVSSADHYLAECFLVDFAKYIPVKSKNGFSQKPNEKPLRLTEKKDCDEKNGCVKLLQFLNPDPLRADEISDLQQLQKVKSSTLQPGVVLRNRIEPCLTMEKSPLSADLKKVNVFIQPDC